jgi:V8-like Glu-specific endopeptidase
MKKWIFISALLSSTLSLATICNKDDRIPSYKTPIGRLSNGCTITMLGRSTAITAGHCVDDLDSSYFVEFNVLRSNNLREMRRSIYSDRYEIDLSSVYYKKNNIGDDYAIFKLKRNQYTYRFAGDVQGAYQIDYYYMPKPGDSYEITGYGTSHIPTLNLVQKSHQGWMRSSSIKYGWINYYVDTTGGNSGSTIINIQNGKIIGIHTHGGCRKDKSFSPKGNNGTLLYSKPNLIRKILQYLDEEKYL